MNKGETIVLMDSKRIDRTLKRMACQIGEANTQGKEICVIGINERGYAVASELAGLLPDLSGVAVQKVRLNTDKEASSAFNRQPKLTNMWPLLVDDVIFSGQTMFKALQILTSLQPLSEIHTAVIIDRGHRKLPVRADFKGIQLPTKANEHVALHVESGTLQKVTLSKGKA